MLVALSPADASTERDSPTDVKPSCCPLWEQGPPVLTVPRGPGCPGTRYPHGDSRSSPNPARCKNGEKYRVAGVGGRRCGGAVSTNRSPYVVLSLGNDSSRGAPCVPPQRVTDEIIFCTDTLLLARTPGWRRRPAPEGSRGYCQPADRLQEPPSLRRGHGLRRTPAAEGLLLFYSLCQQIVPQGIARVCVYVCV